LEEESFTAELVAKSKEEQETGQPGSDK